MCRIDLLTGPAWITHVFTYRSGDWLEIESYKASTAPAPIPVASGSGASKVKKEGAAKKKGKATSSAVIDLDAEDDMQVRFTLSRIATS